MVGSTTFSGNRYTVNSTTFDIVLYAEATPYRVIAPLDASTRTDTSPQETQPPAGVPTAAPTVDASSTLSPGAAAGIAIGAVLVLGVAGFYLWRYLRNRKMAQPTAGQESQNLEAGGIGGAAGPRMADCDDKEAVTDTTVASNIAKPPPYELDISGPTAVAPAGVVEADAGQKLSVQTGNEHGVPLFAVTPVPELGGTAVDKEDANGLEPKAVPAPWSDPVGPGPSRSGAVSPEMGGLGPVGVHPGEMSPATTVAMSSDSRPTSVMPEGGEWSNTVRVSYLQRELKNIRVERERLQRIEQLDAREAELERLVLEEMETLKEGGEGQ